MFLSFGSRVAATVLLFASVDVAGIASISTAHAQSGNGGWFVPKTAQPQAAAPASHATRRVAVPQEAAQDDENDGGQGQQQEAPPVLPAPPIPDSPDLPKEAPPPAASIGVISIPTVMRMSTAADEAQQVLGARRDKLAAAAQREQAGWRDEQQKLQNEARNLTSDQVQLRERHLQERRNSAQHDFANRARIIQEAANVSLNQIERELIRLVRQVAAAHNMNLVMHSEQVALHVPGQDITEETARQLNKVLPHVFIPAEGVDPEVLAKSGKMPTTADEDNSNQPPGAAPAASAAAPAESVLRQHH